MRIGILQTGEAPEPLRKAKGDYNDRMRWLLDGIGAEFRTWRVLDGEIPASPDEADGWIITGSPHGVYEPHDWIAPAKAFVRKVAEAELPMVGICFGHQLIAAAFGAEVVVADVGRIAGLETYETADGGRFVSNAWHQDQVVTMPEGAEIFARSETCPIAGFTIGQRILTIQPHPEFSQDYFEGLFNEKGNLLTPEQQAKIRASFGTQDPDTDYLKKLIAGVMLGQRDDRLRDAS